MNEILLPIFMVSTIGLGAAIILTLVSNFMAVKVDENVLKLRAALPGANCGACGFAGCDEYAEKIAKGEAKLTLCTPGGQQTATELATIMGQEAGTVKEVRAMVRCCGDASTVEYVMDYDGPQNCKACNSFFQGRRSCSYGCLGFGDCVDVCKFGAIEIKNGLAVVDPCLCTGCGACGKVCPDALIYMVPKANKVCVACSSHDKGAYTRKVCTAGCIGCMKCQKTCSFGAIAVEGNLAVIDPSLCTNCGECVEQCPTKCIKIFA